MKENTFTFNCVNCIIDQSNDRHYGGLRKGESKRWVFKYLSVTDLKSDTNDITWRMCCLLYCDKGNHYYLAEPLVHLWNSILVRTAQNWIIPRLMCVTGYFIYIIFLLYICTFFTANAVHLTVIAARCVISRCDYSTTSPTYQLSKG